MVVDGDPGDALAEAPSETTALQRAAAWLEKHGRGRRRLSSAQQAGVEDCDEKTFLRRVHCVAEQSLQSQRAKILQLLRYIRDGVSASRLEACQTHLFCISLVALLLNFPKHVLHSQDNFGLALKICGHYVCFFSTFCVFFLDNSGLHLCGAFAAPLGPSSR